MQADLIRILIFAGIFIICIGLTIALPTWGFTFGWFAAMAYYLIFFWKKLHRV